MATTMLRSTKDLEGYAIEATDGMIGEVKDVYFDDEKWVVRYLIVETGSWLASRKVLISPIAIGKADWAASVLAVSITKDQVKNSPDIDTDKPVSRQHEMQYLNYYSYPYYLGGASLWGGGAYPGAMLMNVGYGGCYADYLEGQADHARADEDPHLRSGKAVMKYHIRATDGDIGHVGGLLVDEETWAVRYLVVEAGNWWLGHQVLIAPQWIEKVSWTDRTVSVNVTRQAVKHAPTYNSSVAPSREQEIDLHQHHGRAGYWANEAKLENPEFHVITSAPQGVSHQTRDGTMPDERRGI
jgi:sporulation protein YlmC with PRC-barrel domain